MHRKRPHGRESGRRLIPWRVFQVGCAAGVVLEGGSAIPPPFKLRSGVQVVTSPCFVCWVSPGRSTNGGITHAGSGRVCDSMRITLASAPHSAVACLPSPRRVRSNDADASERRRGSGGHGDLLLSDLATPPRGRGAIIPTRCITDSSPTGRRTRSDPWPRARRPRTGCSRRSA
jgi:hypothetical protein